MSKEKSLRILSLVLLLSAPVTLATSDDEQTDCEEVIQTAGAEATKLVAGIVPTG